MQKGGLGPCGPWVVIHVNDGYNCLRTSAVFQNLLQFSQSFPVLFFWDKSNSSFQISNYIAVGTEKSIPVSESEISEIVSENIRSQRISQGIFKNTKELTHRLPAWFWLVCKCHDIVPGDQEKWKTLLFGLVSECLDPISWYVDEVRYKTCKNSKYFVYRGWSNWSDCLSIFANKLVVNCSLSSIMDGKQAPIQVITNWFCR